MLNNTLERYISNAMKTFAQKNLHKTVKKTSDIFGDYKKKRIFANEIY